MHKIYFLVAASLLASCGVAVKSTTLTSSNGTFELTVTNIKTFDTTTNKKGTNQGLADKTLMYMDFDFVLKNVSSSALALSPDYAVGLSFDDASTYLITSSSYELGLEDKALLLPTSLLPGESYEYNFAGECPKNFGYADFFFAKRFSEVENRECSVHITSKMSTHYTNYDQKARRDGIRPCFFVVSLSVSAWIPPISH
jgi:hypothetical protein